MYEYGVRCRDGSTHAGFNTPGQAQIWADSHRLKEGTYAIERRTVGYWGEETILEPIRLYTVAEISEILGQISPATIRRLAKDGHVEWVEGSRNAILMTDEQIGALLRHLTHPRRAPGSY